VLFYELLTGTTPFNEDELCKAGYVEMQRVIREQEPTKPSTKLSTLGESLTDIARHRQTNPDVLPRLIRGDLDWVVMKSLEKDRTRRYDTASALAMDVQRHLDDEPVLARAPGAIYRLQKFLCRHRSQAIAATAIAVLISAVIVIFSMWNQKRLQLAGTESIVHGNILSQVIESFSKGNTAAALKTVRSILDSRHVGPKARFVYASILVEGRHPDEAVTELENLLDERPEVAGAAHSLLARIVWESESSDSEKLEKVDEHRRKAQELLPETAEAYFLRAMTALTIKEKLELLDEALGLDLRHYESYRLRAFTYYASKKHEEMKEDALAMRVLRPEDPLGYSLRAIALRELGHYQDAIADYDTAIRLTSVEDPQLIELYAQRCEVYIHNGEYEQVIADAQECLKLSSDGTILHFRIFCALIALGNYDEASTLYHRITDSDPDSKRRFRDLSMKYVFDTLDAGQSWHPGDRKPEGIAFLAMLEAEETYHHLSARGERLITDGFAADWSPDGTKLAFSLGTPGHSGIALFDPASQETELLIGPRNSPKWSPDGQHIAFLRGRQILPLSELPFTEHGSRSLSYRKAELWIMRTDGTGPRRLARGRWPSWSQDPKHVYDQSSTDKMPYSISVEDKDAEPKPILISVEDKDGEPKPILSFPHSYCSVSPDGRYFAFAGGGLLKIVDMASQSLVADCRIPRGLWGGNWDPKGHEFSMGGYYDIEDRTGLWIYDLEEGEAAKVLAGQIKTASWAPDGAKLAFSFGAPYFEIWVAGLDPNSSTVESLGPGRTFEEHDQEMVDHYTRIIEADPEDAEGYLRRALYYQYLDDEERVRADMGKYRAILNPRKGTDGYDRRLEATGDQEGRTDLLFGTPTNLGLTVNSPACDWNPSISADGLELYFDSKRSGNHDIWVTTRATTEEDWGPPANLGSPVNGPYWNQNPCISASGLMLFWGSTQPGGSRGWDIWVATRTTTDNPWGTPVNLGPTVNSPALDIAPSISSDGLSLFLGSERPGGYGSADLWGTTRETIHDDWDTPVNLGPTVNSLVNEGVPRISADGRALFFSGAAYGPFMPDGYGNADLWVTTRATKDDDWSTPVNLGPNVNSSYYEVAPNISMDGSTLYFASNRDGGVGDFDLWQVSITPISGSLQKKGDADLAQKSVESDKGKEVMPRKNR
jgi:Tol biopolymer transport system component/cytochrome c-type biogenesis protein CcmH/NrfG